MASLFESLESTENLEKRVALLKQDLSKKDKVEIGRLNSGLVLDIDKYRNLHIGDKVIYTNVLGKTNVGYISYFFLNMEKSPSIDFIKTQAANVAKEEGRPYEKSEQDIIPVMINLDGAPCTHHGAGLPEKV